MVSWWGPPAPAGSPGGPVEPGDGPPPGATAAAEEPPALLRITVALPSVLSAELAVEPPSVGLPRPLPRGGADRALPTLPPVGLSSLPAAGTPLPSTRPPLPGDGRHSGPVPAGTGGPSAALGTAAPHPDAAPAGTPSDGRHGHPARIRETDRPGDAAYPRVPHTPHVAEAARPGDPDGGPRPASPPRPGAGATSAAGQGGGDQTQRTLDPHTVSTPRFPTPGGSAGPRARDAGAPLPERPHEVSELPG
ncbi:hypothetical protein [Streptomyces sp. NPDC018031]|uniref:hypothetical protein n=1 Tax=Streptomyces sp. NPDC018031 TaxID=3365033 RepID=UPI00379F32D1